MGGAGVSGSRGDRERVDKLWEAIFRACRVDQPDPREAWRRHIDALESRREHLNERAYTALRYAAPGTDLTIGLPDGHVWKGGIDHNAQGTRFVPNIPTEEVFTMPHSRRVDGTVASTKPLNYGGRLIEHFSLTFEDGKVVRVQAESGAEVLEKLIATDEGAARLGEIALVPHGSPISGLGRLFYNTLFDENASSHVALGQAYTVCLDGADAMSEQQLADAGANSSVTHVDFMIGSDRMDIDGVLADGSTEPVMRAGEWASRPHAVALPATWLDHATEPQTWASGCLRGRVPGYSMKWLPIMGRKGRRAWFDSLAIPVTKAMYSSMLASRFRAPERRSLRNSADFASASSSAFSAAVSGTVGLSDSVIQLHSSKQREVLAHSSPVDFGGEAFDQQFDVDQIHAFPLRIIRQTPALSGR